MNHPGDVLQGKAAELRRDFDRAFAQVLRADAGQFDDHLAIRLRGDPHVLPLAEVARLAPLPGLVRFPCAVPAWLGLAGVADAVLPVYDLGLLLGYPAGVACRWMVACRAAPVALAFDGFDGQFRHPREPEARPAPAGHSPPVEVLSTSGLVRPVVSIGRILAAIQSLVPDGASHKER